MFGPNAHNHLFSRLDAAGGRMPVALIRFLPESQAGEEVCRDLCYLFLTMGGVRELVSCGTGWVTVR